MEVTAEYYTNYCRFQSQAFDSFLNRIVGKKLNGISVEEHKTVTCFYLIDKILLFLEYIFEINISSKKQKIVLHFNDNTIVTIITDGIKGYLFFCKEINQNLQKIECNILLNNGIYDASIDLFFPDNIIQFKAQSLRDFYWKRYFSIKM
jgi:hypothetical protein